MSDTMTLAEAGQKYDYEESTLRRYAGQGRLAGEKRGNIWFTTDAAMRDLIGSFKASRHPRRQLPPAPKPDLSEPILSHIRDDATSAGFTERETNLLLAAVIWHATRMPGAIDMRVAARELLSTWRDIVALTSPRDVP